MLCDYNCRILEFNKYKFCFGDESVIKCEFNKIISDINELGSCGFHKLICQIPFNENIPVNTALKNICDFEKQLSKNSAHKLSGKFKISYVPLLCLSATSLDICNLEKLAVSNSNYIFIEMPISEMPDYLPSAINKILYTHKLIPVFTQFHIYSSIYPVDEIKKLINIKNAAFQFAIDHAARSENLELIKNILKNGNAVLLGSECDHSEFNIKKIEKSINLLKKTLGDMYVELVLRSHSFIF